MVPALSKSIPRLRDSGELAGDIGPAARYQSHSVGPARIGEGDATGARL